MSRARPVISVLAELSMAASLFAIPVLAIMTLDLEPLASEPASGTGTGVGVLLGLFLLVLLDGGPRALMARFVMGRAMVPDADDVRAGRASGWDVVAIACAGPAATMAGLVVAHQLTQRMAHVGPILAPALFVFQIAGLGVVLQLLPFRYWRGFDRPWGSTAGREVLTAVRAARAQSRGGEGTACR